MMTYTSGDGAALGAYAVSVVKQEFGNVKEEPTQDSAEYNPSPGATPLPIINDLLPRRYALPTTSGLTVDVKDGKNEVTFKLEK